jgi:hypothetical protein
MAVKYEELTPEEFDAIVTGELNHHCIWLEHRFNHFLVAYFGIPMSRQDDFMRLLMHREGLGFQDKIEITTAILKELRQSSVQCS